MSEETEDVYASPEKVEQKTAYEIWLLLQGYEG